MLGVNLFGFDHEDIMAAKLQLPSRQAPVQDMKAPAGDAGFFLQVFGGLGRGRSAKNPQAGCREGRQGSRKNFLALDLVVLRDEGEPPIDNIADGSPLAIGDTARDRPVMRATWLRSCWRAGG